MNLHNHHLASAVEKFSGATVLVVGDLMLDRFVYGGVERISPEAPIPILRVQRETTMLGGAGNVVRNLVGLKARVHLVGMVGDDATGRHVADMLGELPGVQAHLEVVNGRRTGTKIRYIAGTQQLLRADDETAAPAGEAASSAIAKMVEEQIRGCGAVVLSDYGKGVLTRAVVEAAVAAARALDIPVVVDPKGRDYSRYRGATVVTPNRKELHEATGLETSSDEEVEKASRHIVETCGIANVLATRSQDGMTLVGNRPGAHHLPAEAREVFDVSGAGDTVVATLAAALAAGLPLVDGAAISNAAAGVVVGKVGTAPVHASELTEALQRQEADGADSKVLPLDRLLERVAEWRVRGLSIGFTNGCFDLLHPGHLSLLRQAKAPCDRLIVGLNSDASVARLKGPSRPVQDQDARAMVLASLAMVDAVCVFDEDTPLKLITSILPDVLVKGADYSVDQVVGAKEVLASGGRVVLAELKQGFSTTATIDRIGSERG